jgi:hypothetical protein
LEQESCFGVVAPPPCFEPDESRSQRVLDFRSSSSA